MRVRQRHSGVARDALSLIAFGIANFYVLTMAWLVLIVAGAMLILGWTPVVVTSGSMQPRINNGDVVLVEEVDSRPLAVGSVITYADDENERLLTHRVHGIRADGTIVTWGDANGAPDVIPVDPEKVVGQGRLLAPLIGLPVAWTHEGKIGFVALWALASVGASIIAFWRIEETSPPRPPWRIRRRRARASRAVPVPVEHPTTPEPLVAPPGPMQPMPTSFTARKPLHGDTAHATPARHDRPRARPATAISVIVGFILAVNLAVPRTAASFASSTTSVANGWQAAVFSTPITYYLHDLPTPPVGDSTTEQFLAASLTAPTQATLFNYSTNYDTQSGRWVQRSPQINTDDRRSIIWTLPVTTGVTLDGDVDLTLWAGREGLANGGSGSFTARLYKLNDLLLGLSPLASATYSANPFGTNGQWKRVDLEFDDVAASLSSGTVLVLHIGVNAPNGAGLQFAYDTTVYPSSITFPMSL